MLGVGGIGAPYGIKGWVRIVSFTEPADNVFGYQPWRLRSRAGTSSLDEVVVTQWKPHGKGWVAQLEGVTDRDAAAALQGQEIVVPRGRLPEPEAGTYYWTDLEGLQVVTRDGAELGKVDQLLETGAADVMVVVAAAAASKVDGQTPERHLVPFVVGESVLEVDLDAGRITVEWDID